MPPLFKTVVYHFPVFGVDLRVNTRWYNFENQTFRKMNFKGSCTSSKLQDFINRYLGSRISLRPRKSSVGVIFDDLQENLKVFEIFQELQESRNQVSGHEP